MRVKGFGCLSVMTDCWGTGVTTHTVKTDVGVC